MFRLSSFRPIMQKDVLMNLAVRSLSTAPAKAPRTAFNCHAAGYRKGPPVSPTQIVAQKANLPQSPWKMRFLVMLVSNSPIRFISSTCVLLCYVLIGHLS